MTHYGAASIAANTVLQAGIPDGAALRDSAWVLADNGRVFVMLSRSAIAANTVLSAGIPDGAALRGSEWVLDDNSIHTQHLRLYPLKAQVFPAFD
jgi:hypothetical protein